MGTILQKGRITQTVHKRSVLARTHINSSDIIQDAGRKPAVIKEGASQEILHSASVSVEAAADRMYYAVNRAVNDIAAQKGIATGVFVNILMPVGTEEESFRKNIDALQKACDDLRVDYLGGHFEVSDAVNKCVISIVGTGKRKACDELLDGEKNYGIILTKEIALEGTALIAFEKEAELLKRFNPDIVNQAKRFKDRISVLPEATLLNDRKDVKMLELSQGGILAALWEVSALYDMGLDIDMKAIPVKQETVEICEYFSINPYELISGGSLMIICEDTEDIVELLAKEGIKAVAIGQMKPGKDKVLRVGEDRGCLNRPAPDSIYNIF